MVSSTNVESNSQLLKVTGKESHPDLGFNVWALWMVQVVREHAQ